MEAVEPYKNTLDRMLKKRGTARIWLSNQFSPMPRTTFWRKVNKDELTKEEKQKIKKLLK